MFVNVGQYHCWDNKSITTAEADAAAAANTFDLTIIETLINDAPNLVMGDQRVSDMAVDLSLNVDERCAKCSSTQSRSEKTSGFCLNSEELLLFWKQKILRKTVKNVVLRCPCGHLSRITMALSMLSKLLSSSSKRQSGDSSRRRKIRTTLNVDNCVEISRDDFHLLHSRKDCHLLQPGSSRSNTLVSA